MAHPALTLKLCEYANVSKRLQILKSNCPPTRLKFTQETWPFFLIALLTLYEKSKHVILYYIIH